jgi:hypothetical protein
MNTFTRLQPFSEASIRDEKNIAASTVFRAINNCGEYGL